jgi:hypothetical protein
MQVHILPGNNGDAFPEHDHVFGGQEEVYLLLSGTCDLHLLGRVVALDPDTFVRVGPETRRRLRTGPDGARPRYQWQAGVSLRAGARRDARRARDPALPDGLDVAHARRSTAAAAVETSAGVSLELGLGRCRLRALAEAGPGLAVA